MPVYFCPRCGSHELHRLERNDISPYRGYRCTWCGLRLRDRGSTGVYIGVFLLALFFGSSALTYPVGDNTKETVGVTIYAGAFLMVLMYVGIELFRPMPRKKRPTSPRRIVHWHIARSGTSAGPFSFEQLQQQVASGELTAIDMVLHPNGQWRTAGSIAGLFSS